MFIDRQYWYFSLIFLVSLNLSRFEIALKICQLFAFVEHCFHAYLVTSILVLQRFVKDLISCQLRRSYWMSNRRETRKRRNSWKRPSTKSNSTEDIEISDIVPSLIHFTPNSGCVFLRLWYVGQILTGNGKKRLFCWKTKL